MADAKGIIDSWVQKEPVHVFLTLSLHLEATQLWIMQVATCAITTELSYMQCAKLSFSVRLYSSSSLNKNIDARLYDDDFMKNCELLLIFE